MAYVLVLSSIAVGLQGVTSLPAGSLRWLFLQECECNRCESISGADQLHNRYEQPGLHVHVHTELELRASRLLTNKQQLQFLHDERSNQNNHLTGLDFVSEANRLVSTFFFLISLFVARNKNYKIIYFKIGHSLPCLV